MKMTALKWILVCGFLNATGVAVVALLALVTALSAPVSLFIGAVFVAASVIPFAKARKAYTAGTAELFNESPGVVMSNVTTGTA